MRYALIVLSLWLLTQSLYANVGQSHSLIKQRKEILDMKKELNRFYNRKEKIYQEQKNELKKMLSDIEKEKKEIQELYEKNKMVLNSIEGVIADKTSKIYNTMKPKIAAGIFDTMMDNGKIEDVFDIILKLKEKQVTLILKSLTISNAAALTQMLQNYSVE